jgi:hypothetical protein
VTRSGPVDIPQDAELRESRDTVIQPVLFNDFSVDDLRIVIPVNRIFRPVSAGSDP